ncbi:ABC-type transport auxiliary lipoprotein family protein [Mesorhizobium liriopis]
MKRASKAVSVMLLASLLAGCAALGGGPAPLDTYELTAPSISERPARGRTQILIADPTALKALDGQNIVISPRPGAVEYLSGAQWSDRLPRIVQLRLAETFQKAGGFGGVGRPGEGLAIDYQVIVEIRRFGISVNGGRTADVELFVKLLNDKNGTVRATREFTGRAPVSGAGNAAYVDALSAAFGQAATQIVDWTRSRV